jgi:tryptophanyl-tRNA synthetase
MSKSSSSPQGIIDLLDEPDVIRRKINRAVTDAEAVVRADDEAKPGVTNLLRIYAALSGGQIDDIAARYGDGGYGGFKKDLGNLVADTLGPIRERTAKYLSDTDTLDGLLNDGARRARQIARSTMTQVRDRSGFPPLSS